MVIEGSVEQRQVVLYGVQIRVTLLRIGSVAVAIKGPPRRIDHQHLRLQRCCSLSGPFATALRICRCWDHHIIARQSIETVIMNRTGDELQARMTSENKIPHVIIFTSPGYYSTPSGVVSCRKVSVIHIFGAWLLRFAASSTTLPQIQNK